MEQIKTMLTDEIEAEIDALQSIEIGSEEYKTTVDGLTKLVDKALDLKKAEEDRLDKREVLKAENKDRKVRNGLTAAGIIIPAAVTIWGTLKSFAFDSDGKILTSTLGRGWIQKLLPRK